MNIDLLADSALSIDSLLDMGPIVPELLAGMSDSSKSRFEACQKKIDKLLPLLDTVEVGPKRTALLVKIANLVNTQSGIYCRSASRQLKNAMRIQKAARKND